MQAFQQLLDSDVPEDPYLSKELVRYFPEPLARFEADMQRHRLRREIIATARSPKTRARVAELGLADRVVETNAQAVKGADLVMVCVPVGVCGTVAEEIGPHLKPGAIVSDVGSVKGSVVRDMGAHLPANVHFVPAHPVAGTEHSGPDAGFAELFENRWCILTPPDGTDPQAVERLAALWRLLGAKVETMSPEHHDIVLAITSHIPHLIAYNIVGTAADVEQVTQSEVIKFSAGGFRDFTRIAASDPTMWRDIFIASKDAVLVMHRDHAQNVKSVVDRLKAAGRHEAVAHNRVYRPWGFFESLIRGDRFQVKRITVNPGAKLSLERTTMAILPWLVPLLADVADDGPKPDGGAFGGPHEVEHQRRADDRRHGRGGAPRAPRSQSSRRHRRLIKTTTVRLPAIRTETRRTRPPPHARRPDRRAGRRSSADGETGRPDRARTILARSLRRRKYPGI